jgi:hypothetical protein
VSVFDILDEFMTSLQTAAQIAKKKIDELKAPKTEPVWNPEKILWTEATGDKGLYHRSDDFENPEFKAMLRDLNGHKGALYRDSTFYWVFPDGRTVARKTKPQ